MGTYHHVVLRDSTGAYVARVDPSDYGYSIKAEQRGGHFDTKVLPSVIEAAERELHRDLGGRHKR